MEKRYGATERNDRLMQIGRNKWELIYGYGTDSVSGWTLRERFTHKPTADEIKEVIISEVNKRVDGEILNGFQWNGIPVYLSTENQFNFKVVYDMAEMSQEETLPVKFKLGEDELGEPMYYEFTTIEELRDFYKQAMYFINKTINDGWEEKDSINMEAFLN
ncbi:MAG: hypothetical protein RSA66_10220 [Muribaculaceae bacterium]